MFVCRALMSSARSSNPVPEHQSTSHEFGTCCQRTPERENVKSLVIYEDIFCSVAVGAMPLRSEELQIGRAPGNVRRTFVNCKIIWKCYKFINDR
jgi:hypothetical protein